MRNILVFGVVALASLFCGTSQAAVVVPLGSGVKIIFASQSETYKASDPAAIIWGLAGPGIYASNAPIPSTLLDPIPSISAPGGNSYSPAGGYSTFFNDLLGASNFTAAQVTINDSVTATPTLTSDVRVGIPNWRLLQAPSAPGFAYNQLTFGSNYYVSSNPLGLFSSTPAIPIFINGSVTAGGSAFVKLDGVVQYTWFPGTINTAGTFTPSGSSSSLGQLNYTFLQSGGGGFLQTLNSTGTLSASPLNDGILALSGHFWLAGDPFDITITTVPEPTSLSILSLTGFALLRRRRK